MFNETFRVDPDLILDVKHFFCEVTPILVLEQFTPLFWKFLLSNFWFLASNRVFGENLTGEQGYVTVVSTRMVTMSYRKLFVIAWEQTLAMLTFLEAVVDQPG